MVPNRTLAGRYLLTDRLGRGGFADVYAALDVVLDREVVVKVLPASADPADVARFVAGARSLSRLNHPAIVHVFDADVDADAPYLVMERVAGRPLCEVLAEGRLPPERVARVGEQVAAALVHAHERGVIHRDVKPANVLLEAHDVARLADFGIAGVPDLPRVTVTGQLLESAAYVAPEQVRGEDVGPASDVYALGLLLLEALTGRPPFPGTPIESALARLERDIVVGEDVPSSWRAALRAMTSRDPQARPSAAAVLGWLRAPGTVALHVAPAPAPAARGDAAGDSPRHRATRGGSRRSRASRWHRSATSITSLATASALLAVALSGANLEAIVRPLREVISPPSVTTEAGEEPPQVATAAALEAAGGEIAAGAPSTAVRARVEAGVPREDRDEPAVRGPGPRGSREPTSAAVSREPVTRRGPDRAPPVRDDDAAAPDHADPPPADSGDAPGEESPGSTPDPSADPPPGPGGDPGQPAPAPAPDEPRGPDRAPTAHDPAPREEPPRAEPPREEPPRGEPAHAPAPREDAARAEPVIAAPERPEPARAEPAAAAVAATTTHAPPAREEPARKQAAPATPAPADDGTGG